MAVYRYLKNSKFLGLIKSNQGSKYRIRGPKNTLAVEFNSTFSMTMMPYLN